MAKVRGRLTLVKLASTAQTGCMRYIHRPRGAPAVTQVRYDKKAMRHVLFTEAGKRKIDIRKPITNRYGQFQRDGSRA